MINGRFTVGAIALAISLGLAASNSFAQSDQADGPIHGLADETYHPMTAERFTKTKVVWINKRYFQNHGINLDKVQDLAAMAKHLNDQYGYLIPNPSAPAEFFDSSQTKTVYPDAYGGPGLNGNLGSGRASTIDAWQLKGLGPTNMVGERADKVHSSGGVMASEAIAEAIWSALLAEEAPYGANQVVALIDTGLMEPMVHGGAQPRYLVLREDPLRPAHFIHNANQMSDERRSADQHRVLGNMARLQALMQKLHGADAAKPESLGRLFVTYAQKIAAQWAYLHANFIHHGAVTPSNIELSAKLLDLSSVSTLPGAMLAMGHDLLPFGDPAVIDLYVLKPFYDAIVEEGGNFDVSYEQVRTAYYAAYQADYQIEILKLTGLKAKQAQRMVALPETQNLLKVIESLRTAGYEERVATKTAVPETSGTYDVHWIMTKMGQTQDQPTARLDLKVSDPKMQARLTQTFGQFYAKALALNGDTPAFRKQIAEQSRRLNRDRVELRRNIKNFIFRAAMSSLRKWNLVSLQGWIDKNIERSVLTPEKFESELSLVPATCELRLLTN